MSRIVIKQDLETLSAAAAELFVTIASDSIARRGRFRVALAGGSTPRSLYLHLSSAAFRSAVDWMKVRFYFGDERNVPPDSPESNFLMADETLFRPLRIEKGNVVRWLTELGDVDLTARRYEDELHKADPLDLVLLGLGSDGHTASLFPHTAAVRERERLAVANWVEKLRDYRFTMTIPALNRSSQVIFLVAGEEKAAAVADAIDGELKPDDQPSQLVRAENGDTCWLLDEAAAKLLRVP